MKIFGWAADGAGPGYYRLELPLAALAAAGHTTGVSTRLTAEWADSDVIVGQRVCNPGASRTWQALAKAGARLVYEIDDNLFHVHHSNAAAHAVFNDPGVQARIAENAAAAALVTVSTEPLAAVMRAHNPNVTVLPNCVPSWMFDHERPRRRQVTVGWQGSSTHVMDLAEAAGYLRLFLHRNPEVAFHVMGTDYAPWMRLPLAQCRFTPWVASVDRFHQMIDFDVGVAPLRPDIFNASKSDIRVLSLAALAIPAVATDYGPYGETVVDGETGFLVRRDHEWGLALRTLHADPGLRERMGAKAREHARARAVEANAHRWEAAYEGVR